jgi:hypothetical protein
MNTIPATSADAAKYIEKLAAKNGQTVCGYCTKRGVTPSIITKWRKLNKTYRVSTFLRLTEKV